MKHFESTVRLLNGSHSNAAFGLVLFAALLLPSTVRAQRPVVDKHLSHRELKALIQNATTREEHLRIAAYYHLESAKLQKQSTEHADLESAYANGTRYSPKSGMPGGELQHCKYFAESIAAAAREAEALSVAHDTMAKNAGH